MPKRPQRRQPSRGKKIQPHETSEVNPDTRCPDFCFHHTVEGFTVVDCQNDEKVALINALWQRSRLTWSQITTSHHEGQGSERIPAAQIRVPIPSSMTSDVSIISLRFGGGVERIIGYRDRSVFHIVWVDPRGRVYHH